MGDDGKKSFSGCHQVIKNQAKGNNDSENQDYNNENRLRNLILKIINLK